MNSQNALCMDDPVRLGRSALLTVAGVESDELFAEKADTERQTVSGSPGAELADDRISHIVEENLIGPRADPFVAVDRDLTILRIHDHEDRVAFRSARQAMLIEDLPRLA